jgi:hypothetical protein
VEHLRVLIGERLVGRGLSQLLRLTLGICQDPIRIGFGPQAHLFGIKLGGAHYPLALFAQDLEHLIPGDFLTRRSFRKVVQLLRKLLLAFSETFKFEGDRTSSSWRPRNACANGRLMISSAVNRRLGAFGSRGPAKPVVLSSCPYIRKRPVPHQRVPQSRVPVHLGARVFACSQELGDTPEAPYDVTTVRVQRAEPDHNALVR